MSEQPDRARELHDVLIAMGSALTKLFEDARPGFRALAELASRPEIRAELRRREGLRLALAGGCHCLCGAAHPADRGICDGRPVTTIRQHDALTGTVDVPACRPCATAQLAATAR
jgi:hypothetical protein